MQIWPTSTAPILCAGLATFNALKKCGAEAGDTVAIFGIGGLGHMALQYARRIGFRVVAIGRGGDIAQDALELGAHQCGDLHTEDAVAALKGLGGAKALITTVGDATTLLTLLGSITGSPLENEWTLAFSVLADVRPRIEVVPLERAQEALARMRAGGAKFRMVLNMALQACDR